MRHIKVKNIFLLVLNLASIIFEVKIVKNLFFFYKKFYLLQCNTRYMDKINNSGCCGEITTTYQIIIPLKID